MSSRAGIFDAERQRGLRNCCPARTRGSSSAGRCAAHCPGRRPTDGPASTQRDKGLRTAELVRVRIILSRPAAPSLVRQDARHPVMNRSAQLVRRPGDDREVWTVPAARGCFHAPQPGKGHWGVVRQADRIGPLAGPSSSSTRKNSRPGFAEGRRGSDPLRHRIDHRSIKCPRDASGTRSDTHASRRRQRSKYGPSYYSQSPETI